MPATVYRRLTTLAAEEAQVVWGAFGSIRIGGGVRPLSGFVMVLSYSRAFCDISNVPSWPLEADGHESRRLGCNAMFAGQR